MITHKAVVWLIAAVWVSVTLILWLSVLGASNLPITIPESTQAEGEPQAWTSDTQQPARLTVHNATPEDLGRLSEAVMAFAEADLELPAVHIWFHTHLEPCGEHYGLFRATSESWHIQICSSDVVFVYEHELAHAWVTANVTDAQRFAFMDLRGLDNWADGDVPWNQRGTEWAAVVLQQGVSGLPLPPVLSNEARSRLLAFELLTGRVAPLLVNWIKERGVRCWDRPTDLSRMIADVTGRLCTSGHASLRAHQLIARR